MIGGNSGLFLYMFVSKDFERKFNIHFIIEHFLSVLL
jgi:hypothetical protein